MKPLFRSIVALFASVAIFSCTKEVPAELNVSTTELTFPKDGGNQSISFSTNKDWTASASASWVKVTSSGTSSTTSINVTVEPNSGYDDRTATVTIKAQELTKTVNIRQSTNLGLLVAKNKYELTNDAQTLEIEVQTNVEFEYSIDESCKGWITSAATKALSSSKVKFDIAQNDSFDDREGKIIFKQKGGTLAETVTISQSQTNGLFLTTSEYAVSNSEHDITVEVKANVQFTVTSEADWIQYVETKALTTSNISLKVLKNETYDKRVGTVKVKQTNGSLEGVITITQDETLGLFVTPEEISISNSAQEVEVEVNTNVEFDIIVPEDAKDMITTIKTEGGETKALAIKKVKFGIAENKEHGNREASVTFKQKNGEICGTVKVIQQKNTIINFADAEVKAICIQNWDTSGDGELSEEEAARVTSVGNVFKDNARIKAFTEFSHFTNVKTLNSYAFEKCYSLKEIVLPEGITSISYGAFSGCSSLTSINISEGVTTIEGAAFNGCEKLASINIPEVVTSIGSNAFFDCSSLTSINIPEGVTSIGSYAFCNCTSLASINIPEGITSINDSAFSRCSSLTSINIPEGVTSIGLSAFYGCSSLVSINIPEGVTYIGQGVFCNCSSLISIKIPEGAVFSIGNSEFYGCSSLTSISLPKTITSIGKRAFENCSSLSSINIPEAVTSIGEQAFFNCTSLTNINIPEGITSIEYMTFAECSSLISISLPKAITSIGRYAFQGCSSLSSINIPEAVTSIGDKAFAGCSSLTNINIPEGITSIADGAFQSCSSLTDIYIPKGVTSIEANAFFDCTSLTSIYMRPLTPPSIGRRCFSFGSTLKIYVPQASVDAYKAAWTDYADKIEPYDF